MLKGADGGGVRKVVANRNFLGLDHIKVWLEPERRLFEADRPCVRRETDA